jgi:hypothetical protein
MTATADEGKLAKSMTPRSQKSRTLRSALITFACISVWILLIIVLLRTAGVRVAIAACLSSALSLCLCILSLVHPLFLAPSLLVTALVNVGLFAALQDDRFSPSFFVGDLLAWNVPFVISWIIFFRFHRWQRIQYRIQNGLCSRCEYDLTGNVSGICPECGQSIS